MTTLVRVSTEITNFPDLLSSKEVLNRRQCKNLLDNFCKAVEVLQRMNIGSIGNAFCRAEQDMLLVINKARFVVEECCKDDWCRAVVIQMNNKETFRELLWDFECCFHTMCDVFRHSFPSREAEIFKMESCMIFCPTSIDEVEEDQNSMFERFARHLELCIEANCKDRTLVRYLMGRLKAVQKAEGGELDTIILPNDYPWPEYGRPPKRVGEGATRTVYLTKWLEFDIVTKVIQVNGQEHKSRVWKEACILAGLTHPNLIKMFCCGFPKHSSKDKGKEVFELITKKGIMDLSQFLNQQASFMEENSIDIMLQIASGMCCLHDMKVAHRDLKPDNVVMTSTSLVSLEHRNVKLVDFGISKIEVTNSRKVPTGEAIFGTPEYMAPEALKKGEKVDAFKADVFSFGMMCYEIISRKKPFDGILFRDYSKSILKGKRPKLPQACSQALKSLIHKCWSWEPSQRPTFLEIHQILTKLKNDAIIETFPNAVCLEHFKQSIFSMNFIKHPKWWWPRLKHGSYGVICLIFFLWQMFATLSQWLSTNVSKVLKFDDVASLSRTEEDSYTILSYQMLHEVKHDTRGASKLIGLNEKIQEMKKLLQRIGSLGIVGMGGIGKSTLANALSDHISHQFDATVFVDDFKDEQCTIAVKYKLHNIEKSRQTKTLIEGHEVLTQNLQKTLNILIVLDNVGKASQLKKLLGNLAFQVVDGSKLIASSRDWKALELYVPKVGKVDLQTLDGDQSMELFSMHGNFAINQPCLPYLENVAKKIVNTCDGLPLSLKVMGGLLHGEKRLRVWERALQRLLRARHDGSQDEKIWKTLRVSFNELNDKEKNMFLEISCFFCKDSSWVNDYGYKKETLIICLDDDVNIMQQTIESLQHKSILKVDKEGVLNMHDQLRDMGCMITEKEYHGTRLWGFSSSTFNMYCNQKDTKLIQTLSFESFEKESTFAKTFQLQNLRFLSVQKCEDVEFLFTIVSKTTKLKCLRIDFQIRNYDDFSLQQELMHTKFKTIAKDHFQQLKEFQIFQSQIWKSIPFHILQYIPLTTLSFLNCETLDVFPNGLQNIVTLVQLIILNCKSFKTIQEGLAGLTNLRKLSISDCGALEEFPSGVRTLITLEELNFFKCKSLKKFLGGLAGLTNLKKLWMWECEALEEFPSGVCTLIALEELIFDQCKSLKEIPEGLAGLTNLRKLSMSKCEALEEFPFGVCTLIALETLSFPGCKSLKKIPEGLVGLTNLKKLWMWECEALEEFPSGVCTLIALEELIFDQCKSLKEIPEGLAGLTNLKELAMSKCEALKGFPFGVCTLIVLEALSFRGCKSLKKIPEGLGGLTNLRKLWMWDCEALEEFPSGVCTLIALEELRFDGCKSFKEIPEGLAGLTNLKELAMSKCEALEEFPFGVCTLIALETLSFHGCKSFKKIPEGLGGLTNLRSLWMWDCEALEEFPSGVCTLIALEELKFDGCKSLKEIPEGLAGLTNLRELAMSKCEALEEFPFGVSTLITLEALSFHGCKSLKKIPEGLGGLTNLRSLWMWDCEALEEFPSSVCTLIALEELKFDGCKSLKEIPKGLAGLTNLKELSMSKCEALEEFPFGVCTLIALEALSFHGCKSVKKIPEGLGGLTNLRKLWMWDCEALEEFPSGVCTLIALEELKFDGCKSLKEIPEGLAGLTNLKELWMSKCEALEEFPFGVCTFIALEALSFHGCKSLKKNLE